MAKKKEPTPIAILRDGSTLTIGDQVTTDYNPKCVGEVFIVAEIMPYDACESKSIVVAHLKGFPERKILGFQKEGYITDKPSGLDANFFKKTSN